MKKLILAISIAFLLSIGVANAETGTVSSVGILADGNVQVVIDDGTLKYANLVGADAEAVKKMLAVALTAKTTGATVNVGFGAGGWNRITMQ